MISRSRFSSFFQAVFCWPTLISIVGISLLISLGTWQLYRMKWKESVLKEISDVIQQPAAPLESLLANEDKAPSDFRKITVEGTFEPNLTLKWMARPYKGQVGYHLVVPFHLTNGATLLVDRGWVPQHITNLTSPSQPTTLTLIVRHGHPQSAFTPPLKAESRELYSIQPKEIARTFGLMTLLPYYGIVVEDSHQSYPRVVMPQLNIQNNHLSYALTWYFLALALAVIYVIYIRKKDRSFF